MERQVKDMFIDDHECFSKEIMPETMIKKIICGLLDKSNYYFGNKEQQQ